MRFLSLLILSASLAAAQVATPEILTTQMKEGRKIIDEAIIALGGDNFLNMSTKVERGRLYSFFRAQLSGLTKATVYTKYLVAPEKPNVNDLYLRERQAYGDKERWSIVFNETDGYEVTFRGARPLKKETIDRWRDRRRKDIFYMLLRRLGEEGLMFERRTREIIDNKPLEVVDIVDANNDVVTVYFHYTSKLPIRQLFAWRDENRIRHEEMTIFDNYKDAGGGVMLPKVVQRETDGQKVFSMLADTVEINQPLSEDDLGFAGDVKILERQQ